MPGRLSWLLVAVLATGTLSTPRTAAALSNGDFESGGLTPWYQNRTLSSGESWAVTSLDAHTGSYAATNTGNLELRQDFAGIPAGDILELSFWAKHVGTGRRIYVGLFYSDGTEVGVLLDTTGSGWELFDVTANLVPERILVAFSVFGNSTGCASSPSSCTRTYLDDVRIVVPEAASGILLALGFAGLALRARHHRLT